jgi:hypothetical protein
MLDPDSDIWTRYWTSGSGLWHPDPVSDIRIRFLTSGSGFWHLDPVSDIRIRFLTSRSGFWHPDPVSDILIWFLTSWSGFDVKSRSKNYVWMSKDPGPDPELYVYKNMKQINQVWCKFHFPNVIIRWLPISRISCHFIIYYLVGYITIQIRYSSDTNSKIIGIFRIFYYPESSRISSY